jgi:hypothetical protein
MEKGKKAKEIAGRLAVGIVKIWLCGRAYRIPANPEILKILAESKTDVEALKSLELEEEKELKI